MKKPSLLALAGLAISFAVPAFTQQQDTVDPQIAEQVRGLAVKYDEACNKNDAAAVAAFITEDAIWTTPHGKISGRQAIEKDYAERSFRHYHVNDVSTKCEQINNLGDDIEATGTWSCAFQDGHGHTGHVKGHFKWIIVREVDNLQIRADIFDESAY
jgi:uncharacterized protein (TIGR02246 family)